MAGQLELELEPVAAPATVLESEGIGREKGEGGSTLLTPAWKMKVGCDSHGYSILDAGGVLCMSREGRGAGLGR